MKKSITHIAKQSFVYSIGTASFKFAGVILLPLYTGYFTLEEYGLLSLFITIIMFGTQILMLGQGDSIIKLGNDRKYHDHQKSTFFTITALMFILMAVISIVAILVIINFRSYIDFFYKYSEYLYICIATIFFGVIGKLFLNKIRADERAVLYTGVHIIKLIVLIFFSFYFLLVIKSGIEGVLYSYLLSEVICTILLLYPMAKDMNFNFMGDIAKVALSFGIPLSFATITNTLLTTSDRFILKWYSGDAELGLYDLAYRVATLLNMIVIVPLTLSVYPIIVKMFRREGDKEYYIKIHKFLTIVLFWAGAGISLIGNETIYILAKKESYHAASFVVPLLTLSLVFSGLAWMGSIGMNLSGNTKKIALSGLIAAIINITLNFIFIPIGGMYAASINTIISMVILYVLYIIQSKKYYHVLYEHEVIVKSFIIFAIYYLVGFALEFGNLYTNIALKFIFFLTFPFCFLFLRVFNKEENRFVITLLKKIKNPSQVKQIIKSNFTKTSV